MPRSQNVSCPTCARLYDATRVHQRPGYVSMPTMGTPVSEPMKRLYVRAGKVYEPTGYMCTAGHAVLDGKPPDPQHELTPTFPKKVLCQATGELVEISG